MREILILVPDVDPEQNIEIDVRINGRKKTIKYRVEIVDWEGSSPTSDERFNTLKQRISEYDKDWELVEIGAPGKDNIPIMFRKKGIIT